MNTHPKLGKDIPALWDKAHAELPRALRGESTLLWKRHSAIEPMSKTLKKNWNRLHRMSEANLERTSLRESQPKQTVSIRLDRDLLDWLKLQGRGYQTRINAILRVYAEEHGLKQGR